MASTELGAGRCIASAVRLQHLAYFRFASTTGLCADGSLQLSTCAQALERAEDCLLSSSGMNAATTMLLALVPAGGHIVTTTDCYRRTRQFIQTVLPKMGISATVIEPSDLAGLEKVGKK